MQVHWQHASSGSLQHSAFGVAVFLANSVGESSVWEIEAPADKSVQLVYTHMAGTILEQQVEVGNSSLLTTTNRTYAAAEIKQWGPTAVAATFRRGYSSVDLFNTASRGFHMPLRNGTDSKRAEILSSIPIVARPGQFISIFTALAPGNTTGDVAWVEF